MGKRLTNILAPVIIASSLAFGGCLNQRGQAFVDALGYDFTSAVAGEIARREVEKAYPPKNSDDTTRNLAPAKVISRSIAFNYWKDFNSDGAWDENEFVGIKRKFKDDEKISIAHIKFEAKKGEEYRNQVYNPHGKLIRESEFKAGSNDALAFVSEIKEGGAYDKSKFIPGVYKAVWYTNGNYSSSFEFEIVPAE